MTRREVIKDILETFPKRGKMLSSCGNLEMDDTEHVADLIKKNLFPVDVPWCALILELAEMDLLDHKTKNAEKNKKFLEDELGGIEHVHAGRAEEGRVWRPPGPPRIPRIHDHADIRHPERRAGQPATAGAAHCQRHQPGDQLEAGGLPARFLSHHDARADVCAVVCHPVPPDLRAAGGGQVDLQPRHHERCREEYEKDEEEDEEEEEATQPYNPPQRPPLTLVRSMTTRAA